MFVTSKNRACDCKNGQRVVNKLFIYFYNSRCLNKKEKDLYITTIRSMIRMIDI